MPFHSCFVIASLQNLSHHSFYLIYLIYRVLRLLPTRWHTKQLPNVFFRRSYSRKKIHAWRCCLQSYRVTPPQKKKLAPTSDARHFLTLLFVCVCVGGFRSLPSVFFSCGAIAKRLELWSWNFLTFKGNSLLPFCEFLAQGQVSSADPPSKILQLRHGYSSCRISMKLTGLLSLISTYKMYLS